MELIAIFFAAVAAVASAISAWNANSIAKRQSILQVKIELLPQRLKMYNSVLDFMREVNAYNRLPDNVAFRDSLEENKFFISSELYSYIQTIYQNANKIDYLYKVQNAENAETLRVFREWNLEQFKVLPEKFKEYFKFEIT